MPYGYLGVELFFVISGLLVSGVLIKNFQRDQPVDYFRFILTRGFKIWPSYYTFLIVGLGLAWLLYRNTDPQQIIQIWDLKRYILFYLNYTGGNYHWSFDHVWSLCVEEHFYILLPILFIVLQRFFNTRKYLFLFVGLVIFFGIIFKPLGFYLTRGHDTVSMTQYRIDALGWGVMLNLLITFYPVLIKKYSKSLLISGILLFITALVCDQSLFFHYVVLPSLAPFSFFLMIAGAYYIDFRKLKVLRLIAYYSYNLYLWHVVYVNFIHRIIGNNILGLIVFFILAMSTAVLFTIIVEEKALAERENILSRIFTKKGKLVLKW